MEKCFELVFDDVIIKQLKRVNQSIKSILSKMFDKMEEKGPLAGDLLDSKLHIYEMKNKKPPIRLYYRHKQSTNELDVFEFEMKTSEDKQNSTINRIRRKSLES